MNDERRVKLLQHITIFLEQQAEEFFHVMADDVHFEPFDDTRVLDRSSRASRSMTFSSGRMRAPPKSKSESGEGNPYRCEPLMVAKRSGYGCAATMRCRGVNGHG